MKKLMLFMLAFCLLATPSGIMAARFGGGEQYAVSGGEVIEDNVYAAGTMVNLSGEIRQDAFVAGANLNISGEVGEDLIAVGSNLNILGAVGDDLRAAGANVLINGQIGGEVLVAGGLVQLTASSEVEQDVHVAGGQLSIDGLIKGDLMAGGGMINLNGKVEGNVVVKADEKVIIGPNAEIGGLLVYSSPMEAEIDENATIVGEITREAYKKAKHPYQKTEAFSAFGALLGTLAIAKLLVLLVSGLIAVAVFKKASANLLQRTYKNFGWDLLTGFVVSVLLPLAGLLLMLTVVLSPFAIGAGLLFGLFFLIAHVYAGIFLGIWVFKLFTGKEQKLNWKHALVGILIMEIICFVPLVGFLVKTILAMALFGSMWYMFYNGFFKKQK